MGCVCVPTQYGVSALQSVCVFVSAHFVDVGTQGLDVIQLLCHNHLLMYQIRLWQVGASLEKHTHKSFQAQIHNCILYKYDVNIMEYKFSTCPLVVH